MSTLSFDNYVEPLRLFLQRWREAERASASAKRAQKEAALAQASVLGADLPAPPNPDPAAHAAFEAPGAPAAAAAKLPALRTRVGEEEGAAAGGAESVEEGS